MKRSTFIKLMPVGVAIALGTHACSATTAHSPTNTQAPIKLVLTGSSTVAPLVSEMAKRYEQQHPGARIDVQSGGSSRGIADVRQQVADIGMISRSLKTAETDLRAFPIAKDGIAMIVHKDNPIQALTKQQIIDIYTGKLSNWRDVGGADAPIVVVNKAAGRSTQELFLKYFALNAPAIKADVVIGENEQGIKTVAGNPHAIGYVSIGAAAFQAQQGETIRLLPMNGITASLATVRDGTFPLSRTLHLITKGDPQTAQQQFLEFVQSKQVHDLVEAQYFVPPS